jgi:cysteine desulfurase
VNDPIYLDHNATTPVHPDVVEAMLPYLREHFGNLSSGHVYGQQARRAVDRAREQVAATLGSLPDEVVFTSGVTEANNLALHGTVAATERRRIVTSAVEHPATETPCAYLEHHRFEVTRVPVDGHGQVPADDVGRAVRDDTAIVTVILAQNETGTLMPLRAISDAVRDRGIVLHTDAAQAVGKVSTRVDDLGVDLLSVAGHKLYAPKGIGALYVRRGTKLAPFVLGAGQEHGRRPGTENVPHIVGLGQACELALRDLETESMRQRQLRDRLWDGLQAAIPGLRLNGHPSERLPNTLNVSFPGAHGSAVLAAAPTIAASTGSACHDGGEASPVLLAMGVEPKTALGAVRFSVGRSTTLAQIETAVRALATAYQRVV